MAELLSKDGTRISFDVEGSGPVVILVAGPMQYRATDPVMTPGLVRMLAPSFTVINYDRRGRGQSSDTYPYAVAREVEDLEALIDEAGGEAYIFGVSSGGVLALEAASRMPRKVKGVALYSPPINLDKSSDAYRFDHMQMVVLAAQGRVSDMLTDYLREVGLSDDAIDGFKASPSWPAFAAVGLTIAHDYRIISDARTTDRPPTHWQNAIMPVLVLDGDRSYPFVSAGSDWVASSLHNAQRMTLADQGHDYDPNALAALLTVFFQLGSVVVH